MELSIIIPAYNERENIIPLYNKIRGTIENISYEIIFIDDGSTDGTLKEMERIQDERVRIIAMGENSGQGRALYEGWKEAKGRLICTMDADLQNDPADIVTMLSKIEEGYDIVLGVRKNRKDSLARRIRSLVANALFNIILHEKFRDRGCALKCFKRESVGYLEYFEGIYIFFPALLKNLRICEVEVKHFVRSHGYSKYSGFRSLIEGVKYLLSVRRSLRERGN